MTHTVTALDYAQRRAREGKDAKHRRKAETRENERQ